MKKIIFGLILGLAIAIPVGVHADGVISMIGKQVQGTFPVKLYDKDLVDQAIVIDGVSYLPVREVAESLGLKVGFDQVTGIALSPAGDTPEMIAQRDKSKKYQELQKQSDDLTKQISDLGEIMRTYEVPTLQANNKIINKPIDDTYTTTKAKRDALIAQRDAVDKQLETLRNQP